MTSKKPEGRLAWLDLSKGLAMALVLLGHSMRDEMRSVFPTLDMTYRLVYIFHMTWFFWLSGYTYALSRSRGVPPLQAEGRRLKKQLPLWLGYTLLIWAAFRLALCLPGIRTALLGAGYEAMPLGAYLSAALRADNPWAYHLWFLYALMLITLIIALADAALGGKRLRAVCWTLAALGVAGLAVRDLLQLGSWWRLYDYLTLYLPMVCLGILMADLHVPPRLCRIWGGAGIVYIVVRAVFFSGFSGNSVQTDLPAVRFLIYLLADLLLPGVMLLLKQILSECAAPREGRGCRSLSFLGRESLLIYLLHQPFCCAFLGLVLWNRMHLPALIVMAVCLLTSIAAGTAAAWLRDRGKALFSRRRGAAASQ